MPVPKDPKAYAAYCEKMSRIAKERGYGKWMKGKKASKETIRKMSEKLQEVCNTPEHREKMSRTAKAHGFGKWMRGRKLPHVSKMMKELRTGVSYDELYGDNAAEERRKRSVGNKGVKHHHTAESKERLRIGGRSRRGKTYEEIYGERAAEEKTKRSAAQLRRSKGKQKKPQRDCIHLQDRRYVRWRKKVFERDDWTCQLCFVTGGDLQAHHIKRWAQYPRLRYVVSNGITYCKGCHKKVDMENGHYANLSVGK